MGCPRRCHCACLRDAGLPILQLWQQRICSFQAALPASQPASCCCSCLSPATRIRIGNRHETQTLSCSLNAGSGNSAATRPLYIYPVYMDICIYEYIYIAGTRKMASLGGDIRAYMLRFQAGLPLLRIFFIWFCNVAVWFVWFLADYEYEYFLCSLAICGRGKVSLISVYIAENGIVHGLTDCFNG